MGTDPFMAVHIVLFGFAHMISPNATVLSSVNIALIGMWLGLGYVLTGSLAIPIGIHIHHQRQNPTRVTMGLAEGCLFISETMMALPCQKAASGKLMDKKFHSDQLCSTSVTSESGDFALIILVINLLAGSFHSENESSSSTFVGWVIVNLL